MFCLMDVSGSMTEHMKDLAKRFYMLLYLFLTRRYRQVEIVFIRHTHEAKEVDEETFFHSTETGGTVVSTALEEMRRIVAERYPPAGLEHLRRAGLGRRQFQRPMRHAPDGCCIEEHPAALPVFRLSRGRQRRRSAARRLCGAAERAVAHL